jgi:hypothetical protein
MAIDHHVMLPLLAGVPWFTNRWVKPKNLTNAAPGWNLVAPGNELHAVRSGEQQPPFGQRLGNGIHWILPKNIGSRIPAVVFPLAKY